MIERIFPNAQSIIVAGNIPACTTANLHLAEKQSGQLNMVFIGRMHPIKNLHLLLEALKNVNGSVELTIIATNEDQIYLDKCKQLAFQLKNNFHINWLLDLPPNEIKKYLLNAQLFTLLSEVESFGHAIYEAHAVGWPVLIGDTTPWKQLESQKAGKDLPIKNQELIVSSIQRFVDMDNPEWQSFRKGAHQLAISYTTILDVNKLDHPLFEN